MTAVTGLMYPLAVTLLAQILFPFQSNGSMIASGNGERGSRLIGQEFKSNRFFQGRPSCSSYDPLASGASNLAVANLALKAEADRRREAWRKKYGGTAVPEEMLHASASGLDPEISPEAAMLQVDRVAGARGYGADKKRRLEEYIKRQAATGMSFLRIPRINVVELNMMLENN